jgi:hypothetical protein
MAVNCRNQISINEFKDKNKMKITRNQLIKFIKEELDTDTGDNSLLDGDSITTMKNEPMSTVSDETNVDKFDWIGEHHWYNTVLDIAGVVGDFFGGWGVPFDAINMALYLKNKNYLFAAFSGISMIPFAGDAIGKIAKLSVLATKAPKVAASIVKAGKTASALKSSATFRVLIKEIQMLKAWLLDNRELVSSTLSSDKISQEDQQQMKNALFTFIESTDTSTEEELLAIAESTKRKNKMKTTEQQIREHIRAAIKEINVKNHAQHDNTLSEVRQHVRDTINEIMVGLTPITRMNTQGNAKKARKGNNTKTAVNKADIGFNTFDMQEWASIAGITEAITDDTGNDSLLGGDDGAWDADDDFDNSDELASDIDALMSDLHPERSDNEPVTLYGHSADQPEGMGTLDTDEPPRDNPWEDDEEEFLGGGFVDRQTGEPIDISNPRNNSSDEIPGMEVSAVSGDSSWDDGLEDEVEDLADEYISNQSDPDIFDIRDYLNEIRKR